MKSFLQKLWKNFELYLMVILLTGILVLVFVNIVCRVVFTSPITWSEELARIMFIWVVFLGLSYSTLHDNHIRITFVNNVLFKGKAGDVLNSLIYVVTLIIFIWLFIVGIQYVEYCSVTRTPALQLPRSWFVSILPISGFLMVVRTGYKLGVSIRNLFKKGDEQQ